MSRAISCSDDVVRLRPRSRSSRIRYRSKWYPPNGTNATPSRTRPPCSTGVTRTTPAPQSTTRPVALPVAASTSTGSCAVRSRFTPHAENRIVFTMLAWLSVAREGRSKMTLGCLVPSRRKVCASTLRRASQSLTTPCSMGWTSRRMPRCASASWPTQNSCPLLATSSAPLGYPTMQGRRTAGTSAPYLPAITVPEPTDSTTTLSLPACTAASASAAPAATWREHVLPPPPCCCSSTAACAAPASPACACCGQPACCACGHCGCGCGHCGCGCAPALTAREAE
mmetsp:Transcript_14222/g.56002  ORF Transcript_14222/g.56002 Transcript_14222/m.56002 type:complete len:283 (+) Transcript_14222:485-1333(+)